MAIDLVDAMVKVGAETGGAEAGLGRLNEGIGRSAGLLSKLGPLGIVAGAGLAVAAGAAVGVGVASVKMAGDFQAGMTTLVTGAGESEKNIDMVSKAVLQMARDTGTSTKQLTDGMFMIESAGYHGAAGLRILGDAARGAKVGNADLGTVADATTTILKDFGDTGITSAQAVNTLIATVASGKTHMQDLAGSLSQILPTASAAKVGLGGVMGAMATMTAEGVPAADAATYLRQTILALDAPSTGAKKTLESLGLSTDQVAKAMQTSLPAAVQLITDAVGKKFPVGSAAYVEAIKSIAGGSRTMQGLLDLSGQHMQSFIDNTDALSKAATAAGTTITGWSKVQEDFNFRLERGRASAETLMISLGTRLLPVAGKLLDLFSNLTGQLGPVANFLGSIISPAFALLSDRMVAVQRPVEGVAAKFGEMQTVMVKSQGIISQVGDFISRNFAPIFGGLGDTVTKVAVPVQGMGRAFEGTQTTLVTHQGLISKIADFMRSQLVPAVQAVGNFVLVTLLPAFKQYADYVQSTIIPAIRTLATWIGANLVPAFQGLANFVVTNVLPNFLKIEKFIVANVVPAFESLAGFVVKFVIPAVETLVKWFEKNVVPVLETVVDVVVHNVIPAVQQVASTILTRFLPPLEHIIGNVLPILIPLFRLVGWVLQNIVGPALSLVVTVVGALLTAIGWVMDKLGGLKDVVVAVFQAVVVPLFQTVAGVVLTLLSPAILILTTAFRVVSWVAQNVVGPAFSLLGSALSAVGGKIGDLMGWFGHLKDTIASAVGDALAKVGGFRDSVVKFFTDIPGKIGSVGHDMIQAIINGISSMAGALGAALWKVIHDAVANLPGGAGLAHLAGIPGFALGGVSTGGLGWVGEGKEAELVVGPHLMNLPKGTGIYPVSQLQQQVAPFIGNINVYPAQSNFTAEDAVRIAQRESLKYQR